LTASHAAGYKPWLCFWPLQPRRSSALAAPALPNSNKEDFVKIVEPKGQNSLLPACYIATAVYGSYNSKEVVVLRRYRDEVLKNSSVGRTFIKIYYALSPPVANWLKSARFWNAVVKHILDQLVYRLELKKNKKIL